MGQYHHPVCIEAEEGLNPHGMDGGLKEGEQGFSRPSTPNGTFTFTLLRLCRVALRISSFPFGVRTVSLSRARSSKCSSNCTAKG